MKTITTEQLIEIKRKINSTILCLQANPYNYEDSEFADRIDDLEEIIEILQ